MVAVCAPIYYRPEHLWCGREYQAMLSLGEIRRAPSVLPLIVKRFPNYPLPSAVSRLEYFDLANEVTRPNFARCRQFRNAVESIMTRAATVAGALRSNNAVAHPVPPDFQFPQCSAFEDYNAPNQSAPLRSLL